MECLTRSLVHFRGRVCHPLCVLENLLAFEMPSAAKWLRLVSFATSIAMPSAYAEVSLVNPSFESLLRSDGQAISPLPANSGWQVREKMLSEPHATSLDASACEDFVPVFDPKLSKRWLLSTARETGQPRLVVGRFDLRTGLLVGFQSQTGKRLLFRSAYLPDGRVFGEILHRNEATGDVVRLIDKSKQIDPQTGRPIADLDVAGVALMRLLKNSIQSTPGQSGEHQQVRNFLNSDDGSAVLDAVPVLYAILEPLETDARFAKLKSPFGAILMALQLSTQHYRGFVNAEQVLGANRAQQLRSACAGSNCQFRGREFTVHSTGFFDVLSKSKTPFLGKEWTVRHFAVESVC